MPAPTMPVRWREEMTVNGVIGICPCTRLVFERLFINVPFEGYDCLDEVAWRRGMDCRQLLALLEDAMSSLEQQEPVSVEAAGELNATK